MNRMLNLADPEDRKTLEEQIQEDINTFCETYYKQGHREHLGASEMGEPCWRKLYYKFRWVKLEKFNGRMMRLFNVGHQAETRFIEYLRGIGFEVRALDEDGKQFRISNHCGHYGGSLDGMCKAPARYQISEDIIFLDEFKTNGTGAGFNSVDDGVAKAKPKHFKQMCQYGYKMNLKYGLYLIENKNDSAIKVKIVELDWNLGRQLEDKAGKIIFATEPPAKCSENPAFVDCTRCVFQGICHNGDPVEKNCRSCRFAMPTDDAQWFCSRYNNIIPNYFIPQGCNDHNPI